MDTPNTTNDNDSASNETPAPTPAAAPVKRNKFINKRNIIIAVIVILIMVVAAAYWFLVRPSSTGSPTATKFDSPNALVTKATAGLGGTSLQVKTTDEIGGLAAGDVYAYSIPEYQAKGDPFYSKAAPADATGSGYISDSSTASANYKKLTDFFTSNHFTNVRSSDDGIGYLSPKQTVQFTKYAVYESDDMSCSIWYADATKTAVKSYLASIGCVTKSSYKKIATTAQPFFSAYATYLLAGPRGGVADNLVFGNPKISDGSNGYKQAVVFQEDPFWATETNNKTFFQGYYYKAPGSDAWTFFAGTDSIFACSQFNTDVLKMSFAGVKCSDGTAEKTVGV